MGVDEGALGMVRAHMHAVRVPSHHDKVYKDECMFSFDTPESPGGLFINLTTFQGFGEAYVKLDYGRNHHALYLHEKWTPVPLSPEEQAALEAAEAAAKLDQGDSGGLRLALGPKPRAPLNKASWVVVWGDAGEVARLPLPCPDLPERVLQCVAGIQAHEAVSVSEAAAVWEEERRVSRYAADLPQLPAEGKTISPNPKDWKCEETGVTDNLWLNLSTGFIGSGRQNWDGSGGNGSALRHFEATGRKYPLVVKLGTITPRGADVFSYAPDEDDMVIDPHLDTHLSHWGINMMTMEKTDKTMAELQLELNTSYDYSRITEQGGSLQPVSGPGRIGLINLGNSCYMNSVLQVLWEVPSVRARYVAGAGQLQSSAPANPADDLPTQLSKVGVALVEGRTGYPVPWDTASKEAAMVTDVVMTGDTLSEAIAVCEGSAVRPLRFKSLVGRGHPEFSSGRQQDAAEFWTHLLELVSRAEHAHAGRLGVDPASLNLSHAPTRAAFTFQLTDRVQCTESGAVKYVGHEEQWLGLHIPLEAATNTEAVEAYREREARRARLRDEGASAYISASGSGPEPPTAALDAGGDLSAGGAAAANPGGGTGGAEVVSRSEQEPPVVPQVPFGACVSAWAADETVADVWSAAAGRRCPATKRTRFATFPPYLLLALKRYYTSDNWVPKKMEVEVEVPEHISLEGLRGTGELAPGEVPQPATDEPPRTAPTAAAAPAAPAGPDPVVVSGLTAMGFSDNAAARACAAVGPGASVEQAMEWVLGHLEDPDLNEPLPPSAADTGAGTGGQPADTGVSVESVSALTAMGFTDPQATAALKACQGSVERAADWLFNHMDDLDSAVAAVLASPAAPAAARGGAGAAGGGPGAGKVLLDGPGEYNLVGIISHMGANTGCGHYVAHVKKGGRWYIYNDEKVALSGHPPTSLGYLYLFRRADVPAE